MRFSIIIPNYNNAIYLQECLDSIFKQPFKDYEVIFVDDGSTDNSLDVIKQYNIILLYTDRLKQGGARNKGLQYAKGEYIIFLDSDDYLYPNVLDKLDKKIDNEDIIFLGFFNEKHQRKIYPINADKENIIEKDIWIGCPSKCWRREFIKWNFPENMFLEDVYFTLKGYCEMVKFSRLDELFFHYRFRKDGTQNKSRELYREKSREHIKKLIEEYPQYKSQLGKRLSNGKK